MNAQTFDILNSCSCYGHCNEKQYKNIEKLRNKVLSRSFDTKEWQKECRTVAEIDGIHYIENCSLWTENTIWLTLWMEKRPLIWIYEKENNKKKIKQFKTKDHNNLLSQKTLVSVIKEYMKIHKSTLKNSTN